MLAQSLVVRLREALDPLTPISDEEGARFVTTQRVGNTR